MPAAAFESFPSMGMRRSDGDPAMGMRDTPALYMPRMGAAPAAMTPDLTYRPKPGVAPAGAVNVGAMAPGVESRAKMQMNPDVGPMPPMMVNGSMQFQTPKPAASAAAPVIMSAPRPAPMMMMAPAPASAPAPARPVNPLGGMDPRGIAERGGPMSYSQRGVDTNNPNAYAVGRNRAPIGLRMLERAARRRDPRAIMALANMEQQTAAMTQQATLQNQQMSAEAARQDQARQDRLTMFGMEQQAAQQRDATNFDQQKEIFRMQSEQRAGESALEYQRRLEMEAAQRAAEGDPTQVTTKQIEGTNYVIPFAGKKAMGTVPVMKADAPLPAGLVPQGAVRDGIQYGPANQADGKAPAFTYEKDPNGKITGAVYPVQDPQTGAWRLQRADINGDGVVSPQEAAAANAAPAQGQAVKTKGGNTYSFK